MLQPPQTPVVMVPAVFTFLCAANLLLDITPGVVVALLIAIPTWFLGVKRYLEYGLHRLLPGRAVS